MTSGSGGAGPSIVRDSMGLVETRGWVAAVEAADAMCKTAQVAVVRCEVTRDGLVTVLVRGRLADVEAAVRAGGERAARFGDVVATLVIPKPDERMDEPFGGRAARGGAPVP